MATFTEQELALAVAVHGAARGLNALIRDASGLGLCVALRVVEPEDEYVGPGEIRRLPGPAGGGGELEVLVFKAIVVEAANAVSDPPPDAVIPHGWME